MRMCEIRGEPVGISYTHGEAYCKKCGKKQAFNLSRPWTQPTKCKYCEGEMTTEQDEKWRKQIEKDLKRATKTIKKRGLHK